MSEKPLRHFWHELPGYEEDTSLVDLRAVAQHVLDPIFKTSVTDRGSVQITVPESYRKGFFSIPSAFETTYYRQNEPFSRRCYGPSGGKDQALTFWLKPEAMHGDVEKKLAAFAKALAREHGIDPLEIQYFIPQQETLDKFRTPAGCGVAMATSAEHAADLVKVIASIKRERIAAELPKVVAKQTLDLPSPEPLSGRDPYHWQNHYRSQSRVNDARTAVALRDIYASKNNFEIHPVDIENGHINFDLSTNMAKALGEKRKPLRLFCENDDTKGYTFTHGTKGLALWMKPSFLNISENPLIERPESEIDEEINAFANMLSARHGDIPLYPTKVLMEPYLKNPPGSAASAIVLMTDSAHQNALMSEVRLDIMREFKKLSDGAYKHRSDAHDNRHTTSSVQR